ncbi:hypothetical protein GARC_2423 [Paraglaciecola arctica BSs20135]|uniref:Uncharacterized protein n=1 Tax=Paraglaciecola arctica BSs20135 TaxID=493475 RepID=K6XFH9_9ALTE|nr:hypothetical protein GARC_2423 [Paraglaciecola arctica BSs20135]
MIPGVLPYTPAGPSSNSDDVHQDLLEQITTTLAGLRSK